MKRGHVVGSAVLLLVLLSAANASAGCIGSATETDYGCGDTVIESCIFNCDLNCMSGHGLVIAFTSTVVGLLIGTVSLAVASIRQRWYSQDLNDMEYMAELLIAKEEADK
ncbi:MAG: hypothetical protein J7J06_05940 [Methanosarcinales archaeon]|nr:hypothetical protein [Methanosarcinales archaeon]